MTSAQNARKCFQENLHIFGHAQTQPEKFNLYNGLANLADAVEELRAEVRRLRIEVDHLKRNQ